MKTFSVVLFLLTVVSGAMAAQESNLTPTVCKADLKSWSASKTEILTIEQINERMNTMFACADEAGHHRHNDKKMLAYLEEFYRVHSELANRAFDFITKHGLQAQFGQEENGQSKPQVALNKADRKP
jgi:hypothetical protein